MRLPDRDMSDWERVKKEIAEDAPVPYDASDDEDTPYDPNDDEAVERHLTQTNRIHPSKIIRKAS